MGTSITLKNIPGPIYQRIKQAAQTNHRSMNNEIIACLEEKLAPHTVDLETRLAEAQRLRDRYTGPVLKFEDIDAAVDRTRR